MRNLGPGGVVTDGCRGKEWESLLDFLYIDGVSGQPLYWETINFKERVKSGDALAKEAIRVATEMETIAGCKDGEHKCHTLCTDRARAMFSVVLWLPMLAPKLRSFLTRIQLPPFPFRER